MRTAIAFLIWGIGINATGQVSLASHFIALGWRLKTYGQYKEGIYQFRGENYSVKRFKLGIIN
jgi:hypothetical protein